MKVIRFLLALVLRWLANKLDPMATTDPDVLTVGLDALPIGTAALNAASAGVKLITDLQEEANSPDMLKAAAAKKKLAEMDALALAQQNNDIEAERKAAEAAGQ